MAMVSLNTVLYNQCLMSASIKMNRIQELHLKQPMLIEWVTVLVYKLQKRIYNPIKTMIYAS